MESTVAEGTSTALGGAATAKNYPGTLTAERITATGGPRAAKETNGTSGDGPRTPTAGMPEAVEKLLKEGMHTKGRPHEKGTGCRLPTPFLYAREGR